MHPTTLSPMLATTMAFMASWKHAQSKAMRCGSWLSGSACVPPPPWSRTPATSPNIERRAAAWLPLAPAGSRRSADRRSATAARLGRPWPRQAPIFFAET